MKTNLVGSIADGTAARVFFRCGACKVTHAVDFAVNDKGWMLNADGKPVNPFNDPAFNVCPVHDRLMKVWKLDKVRRTEKECNDKCMSATGPACSCSCGGENHGGAHVTG